jgi:hypothetical protein
MPTSMPDTATIPDPAGDRVFNVRLADIPEFAEALQVGEAAFRQGTMPREQIVGVAMRGSELRAIQAARRAGKDLTSSRVWPPMFVQFAEVPGFAEWYRALGHGRQEGGRD